jgi:hypothetical protein
MLPVRARPRQGAARQTLTHRPTSRYPVKIFALLTIRPRLQAPRKVQQAAQLTACKS